MEGVINITEELKKLEEAKVSKRYITYEDICRAKIALDQGVQDRTSVQAYYTQEVLEAFRRVARNYDMRGRR